MVDNRSIRVSFSVPNLARQRFVNAGFISLYNISLPLLSDNVEKRGLLCVHGKYTVSALKMIGLLRLGTLRSAILILLITRSDMEADRLPAIAQRVFQWGSHTGKKMVHTLIRNLGNRSCSLSRLLVLLEMTPV